MSLHRLPSDKAVRERVLAIEDEQTRLALMYQYLTAGRISEVCGRYAPRGVDAFEVEFVFEEEAYPAVLFVVKTAKRRGKLRPCAIPLDAQYEPWTKPLLEYFREAGEAYPFRFHRNWETSKTYGMKRATKALKGLEWPMIEYTKSEVKPVREEEILDVKLNDKNQEVYLLEQTDGTRKWFTKADNGFIKVGVKIPNRWKHATSHIFRKRRTITLKLRHKFDGFGLSAYGGWTEKSQVDALPGALKYYLHLDIQDAREAIGLLMDIADLYFPKLLIPHDKVVGYGLS